MSFFSRMFCRNYSTVDAAAAIALLKEGATLVDVRTDGEWAKEHPAGAVHIPLTNIGQRASELARNTPVVTICHSGARSAIAARTLGRQGYTVYSVRGGMGAWQHAGGEVVNSRTPAQNKENLQ
jgi:rhodanese-related sulfurtransferase